jgi:hypothetical protein
MKEYICIESPNEVDGGMLVREHELIRCKDCKYGVYETYGEYGHYCCHDQYIETGEEFCAWAEPKETEQ